MRYGFKHCRETILNLGQTTQARKKEEKRPMAFIDLYNSCMFHLSLAMVPLLIFQDGSLDPVKSKQINQTDLIGVDPCTSRG